MGIQPLHGGGRSPKNDLDNFAQTPAPHSRQVLGIVCWRCAPRPHIVIVKVLVFPPWRLHVLVFGFFTLR